MPRQLINLGRAFDADAKEDNAALRVGVTQFKIDFSQFRDWYESEPWLKRNSLVAVAAGEDGLSGLSKDSGWAATRDEICRFAQIIFSGSESERNFWLGAKSAEQRKEVEKLAGPKPCLHGSDAHEIDKLFRPELDRLCWIKADPTFEGLRQALFEPEDRVYIGPTPPDYHDRARVLAAVTVKNSNGWFEESTLPLNSSLVSVIGAKGSGKSALADLIAYAAGSFPEDDDTSFLNRAREHLKGTKVRLEWVDRSPTETLLDESQPDNKDVRYLSQSFVERLCSQDYAGTELVQEIESVVFSHLDPTDTLSASNFAELRAIKTEHTRGQRDEVRTRMDQLIREDGQLRANRLTIADKRARLAALDKEREALQKQLPLAQNEAEAKIQEELQRRREQLAGLQVITAKDKQLIVKIDGIRARLGTFLGEMGRFNTELRAGF